MRVKHLIAILALLAVGLLPAPAQAGGVVTVCDEAHLLAALAGGGTVTFACSGTIVLTNTITIAADTTIDGSGQDVTISGNDEVQLFSVDAGVTFSLNELTLAKGSAYLGGAIVVAAAATLTVSNSLFVGNTATGGGAIFNEQGTVNLSNCTFSRNSGIQLAGAIDSRWGTMSISNSTFSDNSASNYSGAIFTMYGSLAVTNSTFTGNRAVDGGGIYNYMSALTVSDSSFADNIARLEGGGICANGPLIVSGSTFSNNSAWLGGGISAHRTTTISNSTFAGNSASTGGGIHGWWEPIVVANSTLAENSATGSPSSPALGGGIYAKADRTITLQNAIVANNQQGGNCAGAIVDGGGNLSYPDSTCPGINADPKLDPLQNTGGPTQAMPLRLGSAALDAGDDAVCAAPPMNGLDQRGFIRPAGSHCDIGAVEQRLVTTCDEAHLREMVAVGGTVDFACSGVITLTNTITIATDTTIDGSGQDVTISGNDAVRVLAVNPGVTLTLNRLGISHGYADGNAGGIYIERSTVIVLNSAVSNNRATSDGGGIVNAGGALLVSHSALAGNSADGPGGGIRNEGALDVVNSVFTDNHSLFGVGGGIYNSSVATVSDSTFTNNSAESPGGGIYNSSGVLTVSRSTFDSNRSNFWGGGIANAWNGAVTVGNSTFAGNSANYGGGLANSYGGAMTVINSTIQGGGIHNESDSTVMLTNTIVANRSTGSTCTGPIIDGGGNLSYPDATCPGLNADPVLGPLQDNGGPTWTMALGPGSAAIDAADDTICAADPVNNRDQRGVVRPQGVHCDSGAFERPSKWLPIMLVE